MDITKITFDEVKYGAAFEALDVNNDGKITKDDLNAATDNKVKSQIQNVLNDTDDEPVLSKSGANNGITKDTDVKTFDADVTQSKGVVYVVMGNLGACGWCNQLESAIDKNKDSLGNCQIYNLKWADDKNNDLCWSLYKKTDYYKKHQGSAAYPTVLKFVDGKLVDVVGNPRNTQTTINAMIDGAKATNTTDTTNNTNTENNTEAAGANTTTDATKTSATTTKTAEDIKKAAEELVAKYPPAAATGQNVDGYSASNPALAALKKA
nr:hypothetical protein [bacterium]